MTDFIFIYLLRGLNTRCHSPVGEESHVGKVTCHSHTEQIEASLNVRQSLQLSQKSQFEEDYCTLQDRHDVFQIIASCDIFFFFSGMHH